MAGGGQCCSAYVDFEDGAREDRDDELEDFDDRHRGERLIQRVLGAAERPNEVCGAMEAAGFRLQAAGFKLHDLGVTSVVLRRFDCWGQCYPGSASCWQGPRR